MHHHHLVSIIIISNYYYYIAIGSALYGLQKLSSDKTEVRSLVAALAEKVETSTTGKYHHHQCQQKHLLSNIVIAI